MKPQNKTLNKQSPKLFHVNNFKKYVSVTSIHNLIINHKNIIKNGLSRGDFVELRSDKRPKKYKVLGFSEPLPFIDALIRVSLQYKNNFYEVDISDIKDYILNAFSRISNKSLSNRYAVAGLHTDKNLSRQNSAMT